jgi:sugar phosphate isomerase/epimerase
LAEKIGAKTVNFYPPHRLDKDGSWFSEDLPKIAATRKDTVFSVINVEPKTILFFIPEYRGATLSSIKKITGKTTFHVSNVDPESGVDLMKTFTNLGNTIVNVLLSDRSGGKTDLLPGRGDAPLESLLIKLRDSGYKGDFTLKVAPKELSAGDDAAVLKKLAHSKTYFEKHYPTK